MYTVGDFIIRIKNAALAKHQEVSAPYSRISENVARVMVKGGFLARINTDEKKKLLTVRLVYKGKEPALSGARIISRPGLRIYKRVKDLSLLAAKLILVSTPKGIMSAKEAKKLGLGGEILAEVW